LEENTNEIPELPLEESEILTAKFFKEEVKGAIMLMERNKAPGQDGLPEKFIKKLGGNQG
jgi:hypothetical protein